MRIDLEHEGKRIMTEFPFLGELILSFLDKRQNQGQGAHIFQYQTVTALKQRLSL